MLMLPDLLNFEVDKEKKRLLGNSGEEELNSEVNEEELTIGPVRTSFEFKYHERLGSISTCCVFIKTMMVLGMIVYAGWKIVVFINFEW